MPRMPLRAATTTSPRAGMGSMLSGPRLGDRTTRQSRSQPVEPSIACVVPCHNEEAAIGQVIRDLREALPTATIYVYDNASTDRTVEVATREGAIVRHEPRKGKGNV